MTIITEENEKKMETNKNEEFDSPEKAVFFCISLCLNCSIHLPHSLLYVLVGKREHNLRNHLKCMLCQCD